MKTKIILLNLFWIAVVIGSSTAAFLRARYVYTGYDYHKGHLEAQWEVYRRIKTFNPVRCKLNYENDPNLLYPFKDMILGVKPLGNNTYQFCIDDYTPVEPEAK